MKKTINISANTHKYLKVYAAQNSSKIEICAERIIREFLIRAGTMRAKEVKDGD